MYDVVKKFLLVDLPSLDFYPKLAMSLVLMSFSLFILVSMWRDPARASSIDPAAEARLREGVRSFFANQSQFAPDVPVVFGNAKDIVRRLKTEKGVFERVGVEIDERKARDNNWKFANELSAAKALVNALGLDYDTSKENQIFLQMPLPTLEQHPVVSKRPDAGGARPAP